MNEKIQEREGYEMLNNKNARRMTVLVIAFLISVFPVFSGMTLAEAKTITLSYAESGPPSGLGGAFVNIMKEEIEKATDNQVTIEVFWQGSLLKGKEILEGVKNGMVDMGYVLPAYFPKQLFVHNAFTLFPQGPTGFKNVVSAITRSFETLPEFGEELSKWDQRVLYMRFMLPMALTSTRPVEKLEDFKGMKIRASSSAYLKALQGAGANPVSVPWGDCYMALQTGTVDGVFTNFDGIHATKLHEPGRHIFTTRQLWVPMPIFVTINNKTWQKLPEDIRDKMLKAQEPILARFAELFEKEWDRIVEDQKKEGATIVRASDKDIEDFVSLQAWNDLRAEWSAEAPAMGVKDPQHFLDTLGKIIGEEIDKEKKQ
ncbi:MAG TPA: C4-dicarboxylate TRAP transporter substrate-binding protein [Synergistales bacterium]|nr:C4-dicarboxylate TRAP transporter substrate-binding protein [Synergistales bacterium]